MQTRILAIMAFGTMLAFGGVACSENDLKSGGTATSAPTTSERQSAAAASTRAVAPATAAASPTAKASATVTATAKASPTAAASAAAEKSPAAERGESLAALQKAAQAFQATSYHLVYDMEWYDPYLGASTATMTFDALNGAYAMAGTMTSDNGDGPETWQIHVIDDGTDAYLCMGIAGLPPEDSTCMKTPSTGTLDADMGLSLDIEALLDEALAGSGVEVAEVEGRTIAGYEGRCFQVETEEADLLICVNEAEGLPLLVEGKDGDGTGHMILREFSHEPPADAFIPPYPVTDLDDIP